MTTARKLFYYNSGFLHQKQLRRIMSLAGYKLTLGLPNPGDLVAVWGQSPNQYRGQWMAKKRQVGLLRVEDAFLRSVQPGRAGDPPLGLILDRSGCHFDASHPCDLENMLRWMMLIYFGGPNRQSCAYVTIISQNIMHLS